MATAQFVARVSFDRPGWMILFVLLAGLASATMVNGPALFLGYGLTFPVMLLGAWMFRPLRAATLVLIAMLLALPFYVLPHSIFLTIALFAVVLRPSLTYVTSKVYLARGRLASVFALAVIETSLALTIGVLYYGADAIETGLSIFGVIFAIYCYSAGLYARQTGSTRVAGVLASLVALLAYFLALYSFLALWTAILSLLSVGLLILATKWGPRMKGVVYGSLALAVVGLALGGQPLLSNVSASSYPFLQSSWTSSRWAQSNSACPVTSNAFASVHDPSRLRIVNACVSVTGQVGLSIERDTDGDFSFQLRPTTLNASVLSLSNYIFWGGYVHVEVVPADQQRILQPIGGVCPGDMVKVTGALVIDTDHGMFSELHPVYSIQKIVSSGTFPSCLLGQSPS